uniref:Reverse transcriptase zinc-binding domain-containing protein n=1 Tax=Cannabis sativa TaxID=3483 RepID=A0A803P0P1_CANSA
MLLKPFSHKEIKRVMFSISDSKSPGPVALDQEQNSCNLLGANVCLLKAYGGLGFKDDAKWNQSILAKLSIHRLIFCLQFVQAMNHQLLTRVNLLRFQVEMATVNCPVCDAGIETHEHPFFKCSLSRLVIKQVFEWMGKKLGPWAS